MCIRDSYDSLNSFFSFNYTPAPATGFKNIFQLLPGQYISITGDKLEQSVYWELPQYKKNNISFDEASSKFEDLFTEVIKDQMVSDVSCGILLSGGLDSATIAKFASNQVGNQKKQIPSLTVGVNQKSFDETEKARLTANALGLNFNECKFDCPPADLIEKASKHLEEPTADSSSLAFYHLSEQAKKHFTVALSCLLYTSPSPRDATLSRMPSSA